MDHTDLLAATRAEFMTRFSVALDEVVRSSALRIFDKAGNVQSQQQERRYLDCRTILLNQDVALKRQTLGAMEQLLNRGFQTAYSAFRPSFRGSMSLDSLSLVDTSTLEDELHVDELTKKLRHAAENPLRDLNIRIALLFGQEEIRERENPFRPYLLVRSIIIALEKLDVSPELVQPLSAQLVEAFADHVPGIYEAMNALLAGNGIAAQLRLTIKKSADMPTVQSPALPQADEAVLAVRSPAVMPPASGVDGVTGIAARSRADALVDWVLSALSAEPARHDVASGGVTAALPPDSAASLPAGNTAGGMLRSFFAGKLMQPACGDSGAGIFLPNPASDLSESIRSLAHHATPEASAMHDHEGRVRNLILEQRQRLGAQSRDADERMVVDMVAMLFEFILRDSLVPAEVRAQLGRLQFLTLKVALLDPAFFSQKSHPARLLINRIGATALGLQQIDPDCERVSAEICHIVDALLAEFDGDAVLFTRKLDEFDRFVAGELLAEQKIERAVRALENAQSQTLQFAHIRSRLADALAEIRIDDYLKDFLLNTWARVIERAGRSDAQLEQRMRRVVPDLVWSVIPKTSEQERSQLFGLIPNLLESIRTGLALIGWTVGQQGDLIDWLIDSHRYALRAGNLGVQVPPTSFFYTSFERFINTAEGLPPGAVTDSNQIDDVLLEEAISEARAELVMLDRVYDLDVGELMIAVEAGRRAGEAELGERLCVGGAIEILLKPVPVRAHLSWICRSSGSMVIAIEDMPAPVMLSVDVFRGLLATDKARFVEQAPLFERAVQALFESATRLDLSGTDAPRPAMV